MCNSNCQRQTITLPCNWSKILYEEITPTYNQTTHNNLSQGFLCYPFLQCNIPNQEITHTWHMSSCYILQPPSFMAFCFFPNSPPQPANNLRIGPKKQLVGGFQPIWKIYKNMSQIGFIFPNFRGENEKNVWVATIQPKKHTHNKPRHPTPGGFLWVSPTTMPFVNFKSSRAESCFTSVSWASRLMVENKTNMWNFREGPNIVYI